MSTPISPRPPRPPRGASAIGEERSRRPWWLWLLLALLLLALLAGLIAYLVGRSDDDSTSSAPVVASVPTAAATPLTSALPAVSVEPSAPTTPVTEPSVAAEPSAAATPSTSAETGTDATGTLVAGSTDLLSGPATATAALTTYARKTTVGNDVLVQSVPADEGFWVGTSTTNRVWVQLRGSGESGYQVRRGDHVDFTGTMTVNPRGFARSVGVDAAEGAAQLTAQAQHILVQRSALTLHK